MSDRERIIDKIKKLKDHAESADKIGSQEEAQAFAAMMQRMMTQHKVGMSELEYARLDVTDPVVELRTSGQVPRGGGKSEYIRTRSHWMETLAGVVGKAHHCLTLIYEGSALQCFVGRRTDAEAALMTFNYLAECAASLADSAYNKAYAAYRRGETGWSAGYHRSYLIGFCIRLRERYENEVERMRAEYASSSVALIRLKDAMIVVDEYMLTKSVKAAKVTRRPLLTNLDAFKAGQRAADEIKLREESQKLDQQRRIV